MASRITRFRRDFKKLISNQINYRRPVDGAQDTADYNYIFIVSHMRSGSTLLAHLLGSHRQVHGHAEALISYMGSRAFDLLHRKLLATLTHQEKRPTYLLDKLLHTSLGVPFYIHPERRVRYVFLFREPEDTLRSILRMMTEEISAVDPGRALLYAEHYLKTRYEDLEHYYRMLPKADCHVLTYEKLLAQPQKTLDNLGDFLKISDLKPEYKTFGQTGKWGVGDGSSNIWQKRILSSDEKQSYGESFKEYSPSEALVVRYESLLRAAGIARPGNE